MEDLTILNEVHHFNNPDIQLDKDKTVSVYLICLAIDIFFLFNSYWIKALVLFNKNDGNIVDFFAPFIWISLNFNDSSTTTTG